MRRNAPYAILVSIALLLQAMVAGWASGGLIHTGAGSCVHSQSTLKDSTSATENGGAHQTKTHAHGHCAWCTTNAPLFMLAAPIVARLAADFSSPPFFVKPFEPRSDARLKSSASPRAPPALS